MCISWTIKGLTLMQIWAPYKEISRSHDRICVSSSSCINNVKKHRYVRNGTEASCDCTRPAVRTASNGDEVDDDVNDIAFCYYDSTSANVAYTRIRRVTRISFSENIHLEDREITA